MKVLIIKERGHHEKNRDFQEALCLQRAFQRMSVPCTVWGLGYDNFSTPFCDIWPDHDVILILENYEEGKWIPPMAEIPKPKLFWSIDAHWNLSQHLATVAAHKIDLVLSSTYSFCSSFKKVKWFPNAYPADLISPLNIPKTIDLGFCGNVVTQERASWIHDLTEKADLHFDQFVIGNDMVKAICSYKIHWNRNIADDTNFRVFETLGCGTLLFTNKTDRLDDLFISGEHLIVYDTLEDCLTKVKYYLEHDDLREKIALAGHEFAKQHHTYDNRAADFLNIAKDLCV